MTKSHDRAALLYDIAGLLNKYVEAVATIVYGFLAIALAFGYAVFQSAPLGAGLAAAAAGLTYVFQAYQLASPRGTDPGAVYLVLWALPITATVASLCASFFGV